MFDLLGLAGNIKCYIKCSSMAVKLLMTVGKRASLATNKFFHNSCKSLYMRVVEDSKLSCVAKN